MRHRRGAIICIAVVAVSMAGAVAWEATGGDDEPALLHGTAIAGTYDPDALGRTEPAAAEPRAGCERGEHATAGGASAALGLRLFGALHEEADAGENVVLSPLSLSIALQMLSNGADEGVWQELLPSMCLHGLSVDDANRQTAKLVAALGEEGHGVELTSANAIWTLHGYQPDPDVADSVQRWFDATIGEAEGSPGEVADMVNAWASDKTRGRIEKVLSPDAITPDLAMMLANAITFDGTWQDQFDESSTHPADFTHADDSTSKVQMMSETIEAEFAESDAGVPMVRLAYGDTGRFGATIMVPPDAAAMDELVGSLTAEGWQELRSEMTPTSVHVGLPRMRVDTLANLEDPLVELGMPLGTYNSLFDPPPRDPAVIKWVKQADMLQFDEQGTKAAAVTVVGVGILAGFDSGPAVIADRPFVVVIDDSETGAILFTARIADPGDGSNVSPDA